MAGGWSCWKPLWKRAVLRGALTGRQIGNPLDRPPDARARKRSIGRKLRARACGCTPWGSTFGNVWWRGASAEGRSESAPGAPAFGVGSVCAVVFPTVDRAVAEKGARRRAADPKCCGPSRARHSDPRLPAAAEEKAARARAILRADLLVAGHAVVFDFSAVELRSDPGGGGGQPAGGRRRSFRQATGAPTLAPGAFDPDQRLQPGPATDAFGVARRGLGAPAARSLKTGGLGARTPPAAGASPTHTPNLGRHHASRVGDPTAGEGLSARAQSKRPQSLVADADCGRLLRTERRGAQRPGRGDATKRTGDGLDPDRSGGHVHPLGWGSELWGLERGGTGRGPRAGYAGAPDPSPRGQAGPRPAFAQRRGSPHPMATQPQRSGPARDDRAFGRRRAFDLRATAKEREMDRPVAVHHLGRHGVSGRTAGPVVWATLASRTALSFGENPDETGRVGCVHAGDGAQGILCRTTGLQPRACRHVGGGRTLGRRQPSPFFQPSTARVAGALQGLGPRRHRPR